MGSPGSSRPVVVGVAGGSGSGKSTVVRELRRLLAPVSTALLRHDAYYRDLGHLPLEERAATNFDHPDSLETELLIEHLAELVERRVVSIPSYDFATHTRREETTTVEPANVLLVDGILVLADARLRGLMDLGVFVETEPEIRLARRVRRDVKRRGRSRASVVEQFERTVRPMHEKFVEPSREQADLVVEEGGFNRLGVERVLKRIHGLLQERGLGLAPPPRKLVAD